MKSFFDKEWNIDALKITISSKLNTRVLNKAKELQNRLDASIFNEKTKENRIVKDSKDIQDEIVKKKQAELERAQQIDKSLVEAYINASDNDILSLNRVKDIKI